MKTSLNPYIDVPGVFMPFPPFLWVFLFGAAARIGLAGEPPIPFQERTGLTYELWLGLSLVAPLLALAGFILVHWASGRWCYLGLWFRAGGSIGTTLAVLAFQVATTNCGCMGEQVAIYYRYVIGSVLLFLVAVVIPRDVLAVIKTERAAFTIQKRVD